MKTDGADGSQMAPAVSVKSTITRAAVGVKATMLSDSSTSTSSTSSSSSSSSTVVGEGAPLVNKNQPRGHVGTYPSGAKQPGLAPFGAPADGKRLKNEGGRTELRIDEAEFTNEERDHLMKDKKKTLRCSATTEALVNAEIRASRPRAIQEEKHLLVLLKDMQLVQPLGTVPDVPQAAYVRRIFGYAVGCWICGLVYDVSKWKSTLRWRCTLWPIVTQGSLEKGKRTSVGQCHKELMTAWLTKENQRPERVLLHWPVLEEPRPGMMWLRCQKCSTTSLLAHKRVFVETKCASTKRNRLDEACTLNQDSGRHPDGMQRGGHRFRAMTLNVGTLKDRIHMIALLGAQICCLQETCVSPNMWASVRSAVRSENGSIVMSPIDLLTCEEGTDCELGRGLGLRLPR